MWLKDNVEIVSIFATTLVLVSFLMKGERKIRTVNIAAAVVFILYGVLINSFPVWFMSTILVGIHIYRIHVIQRQTKYLHMKAGTFYTHNNQYIQRFEKEEK